MHGCTRVTFPHDVVVGTYIPKQIQINMQLPSGQRRDLRKALENVTMTLAFVQIPLEQGLDIPAHGPVGDQPNSRCPNDEVSIDWRFRRTGERNARSAVEKRPFSKWLCFLWSVLGSLPCILVRIEYHLTCRYTLGSQEISQVNDVGARPRGHECGKLFEYVKVFDMF